MKQVFSNLFFLLFSISAFSQQVNTDSIDAIVNSIKSDTARLTKLRSLCNSYVAQRNLHLALEYTEKTMVLAEKLQANEIMSRLLVTNIDMLIDHGNYKKALEFGFRYKTLAEKMKSKRHIIESINSIGIIYWYEGESKKALPYYEEALKLSKEINDERQASAINNNLGIVYRQLKEYTKAIEYYNQSIILSQKINNEEGIANAYNNIGVIYQIKAEFPKALFYLNKSLEVRRRISDEIGIATSMGNIGAVYFECKKYTEAEKFLIESHEISRRLNDIEGLKEVSEYLSKLYEMQDKQKEALYYYKEFILSRDSLQNEELKRDALKNEMEYRFNKEQERKTIIVEADKRRQNIYTYSVVIILFIVCVFSLFLYNRFRITHRQKKIIDEKQQEILASIHYAKRIQGSLLPSERYIEKEITRLKKN